MSVVASRIPVILGGLGFTLLGASAAAADGAGDFGGYLTDCHARHLCNGTYVVARDGKTIFAGAVGDSGDEARTPLQIDSSLDIGSISKQFTAMAVLRLVAERKVGLDTSVATYLPDFPYPEITVRQLLTHVSGLPDMMPHYSKLLRQGPAKEPVTGADIVAVLARARPALMFRPGERFAYSNTGYMVLAALVERQTGRPFASYLETAFFKPLGMKDTRLRTAANESAIRRRAFGFGDAPAGARRKIDQYPGFYIQGAGGIYSTVQDLLKWQNALNAGRVISRSLLAQAVTPVRLLDGSMKPYGFGLSLKPDTAGNSRISHGGHWRAFKSDLSYYPATRLTVIQLTNSNQDDSVDANAAALAAIAAGRSPDALPEPIGWKLIDKLGNFETARAWFEEEASRRPQRYDVQEVDLNRLGYALLAQKDMRAVSLFRLVTLAFPHSANAFDSLADAHEAAGDLRAAYAAAQAAAAIAPESPDYAKHVARLAAQVQARR